MTAYFARIGYSGRFDPTLKTLNDIVRAHVRTIPFENLDVILGRPIELSPDALARKLVDGERGGYCFEQNGLLLLVLASLGFRVTPLGARVRIGQPRDAVPSRTHLLVRVDLEGEAWLVDVGIGAFSLASAIRLDTPDEQQTPHEPRRIIREGSRLFHQALVGSTWQDVYEFTLEEMPLVDRELANWYTSTHPESHFRHNLMAARALDDGGRVTLLNREFTIRQRSGEAESRCLDTPQELLLTLARHFGLHFEPGTEFPCPGLDWPPG